MKTWQSNNKFVLEKLDDLILKLNNLKYAKLIFVTENYNL